MDEQKLQYLRDKANSLPLLPGVYFMKDKTGKVIYIGKAKALKNRVSSYFRGVDKHFLKTRRMVGQVDDFSFIVTNSEFEALVLESSQIKQYAPKYNILLKDDKGYSYVRVTTDEEYPRIRAQFQKGKDKGEYIGPYPSNYSVKQAVEETNRYFMLPTCRRKFPQEIGKGRPCLNYHIKRCIGVCTGAVTKDDYRALIDEAVVYLKQGVMESVEELERRMMEAADNLDFEQAAFLRNRIHAIRRIREEQKVFNIGKNDVDVIAIGQAAGTMCFVVMTFRDSRLVAKDDFLYEQTDDPAGSLYEFMLQYYTTGVDIPHIIAVEQEPADVELLAEFLSDRAGRKARIIVPQRGELRKLVEMARKNADNRLAVEHRKEGKNVTVLEELRQMLSLDAAPEWIEAYDISHLGASDIVGGMAVFHKGERCKSDFRRFMLKGLTGPDDPAAIHEVLSRRFARYNAPDNKDESFGRLPDLILVDGGPTQLAAALRAMAEQNVSVPVFGMVKDGKHRTRAITAQGGEIEIKGNRGVFALVGRIQEEVHRYTITYQRQKRTKRIKGMALMEIEGVGEATAKAVMKQFKTIDSIRRASVDEIAAVPRVSRKVAQRIHDALNAES